MPKLSDKSPHYDASSAGSGAVDPLCVKGLSASYGMKRVLHEVGIAVHPREILAVLGPNGAGKSSLLKAVIGLLPSETGTIAVGGQDITTLPTFARANAGLSYLPQSGGIFPSLSTRENLELALRAGRARGSGGTVEELLADFETLKPCLPTRAGALSGGQRRILAASMLFARHPAVLLLDEPSAGLSPAVAAELLSLLSACCRKRALAAVLVEQRVSEALAIADRAILLVQGSVANQTNRPAEWRDGAALEQFYLRKGPLHPGS